MKVILSRKGFDSTYGGYPSPIFNNKIISLPIPDIDDKIKYSELNFDNDTTYYDIMKDLKKKIHIKGEKGWKWELLDKDIKCHLDPDINPNIIKREEPWKPIFGQMKAASRHLTNNIKEGDLFLFFGRFREVEKFDGSYRYNQDAKDKHVIFGYLQIEKIIKTNEESIPQYARHHPHAHEERKGKKTNVMFIAKEKLSWDNNIKGAGVFGFNEDLVLTKEGMKITQWRLPNFFRDVNISYHTNSKKYGWKTNYFQSAERGQEFVISENKDIENWAKKLIEDNVII